MKSKGCSPTASKVASLMGVDLVDETLRSCLPELRLATKSKPSAITGSSERSSIDSSVSEGSEGERDSERLEEQTGKGASSGNRARAKGMSRSSAGKVGSRADILAAQGRSTKALLKIGEASKASELLCGCATCQLAMHLAQDSADPTILREGRSNGIEDLKEATMHSLAEQAGEEGEDAAFGESLLSILMRCRAFEDSGSKTASSAGVDDSANGRARPYGTDLDAAELDRVMASRKARMPGIPSVEEAEGLLTLHLLEKIAAVAPLRAFYAAVVQLFARHDCLHRGPVPIIASCEISSAQPRVEGDSSHPKQNRSKRSRSKEQAPGKAGDMSDYELRDFAMKIAAEKHPILERWLKLQMDSIDSLKHLQSREGT